MIAQNVSSHKILDVNTTIRIQEIVCPDPFTLETLPELCMYTAIKSFKEVDV